MFVSVNSQPTQNAFSLSLEDVSYDTVRVLRDAVAERAREQQFRNYKRNEDGRTDMDILAEILDVSLKTFWESRRSTSSRQPTIGELYEQERDQPTRAQQRARAYGGALRRRGGPGS